MVRSVARILDWAGESQYYAEPKRLARLGYLEARKEPGKTRERTVYTLTDKGLDALHEYARTPARFVPVKSELLLRLLIADLVGEAATRESISPLVGRDRGPRTPASTRPKRVHAPSRTVRSTSCSRSTTSGADWPSTRRSSTRWNARSTGQRAPALPSRL